MRAWLFSPGHEQRKVEKALRLGVPVVLDWEDGVPAGAKELARKVTSELVQAIPPTGPMYVRLNGEKSPWFTEDIEVLSRIPGVGIMLPKAESPEAVELLGSLGRRVVPMIETPLGLENALVLASAHPNVERLAFGYLDYLASIGARWTVEGETLLYARSRLVLVSRLAGVGAPLDGVYPYLNDLEGLRAEARQARDIGFFGKLVVHPSHLLVVEEAFAPSEEERRLVETLEAALADAQAQGKGSVRLPDGRFADAALLAWAKSVLRGEEG